jgi:dTMP kinase
MPLFVTFEGLDGSGKSWHVGEQARRLDDLGLRYQRAHEPGGTPLGEAIRAIFLDRQWHHIDGLTEAMLLFASRRHLLQEVIEPALQSGAHVLCDRFTDSTIAYQGVARGIARRTLLELDLLATGGRRPDLTLLFDCPAEIAWQRRHHGANAHAADRLDVEGLEFYSRVREAYREMAAAEPGRFRVIDSSGDRCDTVLQVTEALDAALEALTRQHRDK